MKFFTRTALAGVVAIGLSAGLATAAYATNDPSPVPASPGEGVGVNAKDRCNAAIDRRLADLTRWTTRINSRTNLTSDQKTTIVGYMTPVSLALTTVAKPALDAAVTKPEIRAACRAIVRDYRVYRVVHPQVFITAAADAWLNRLDALATKSATLAGLGKDVTKLNEKIAAALALVSPIPPAMAALTPAGYNAAPRATDHQLRRYRHQLERARWLIRHAERIARRLAK